LKTRVIEEKLRKFSALNLLEADATTLVHWRTSFREYTVFISLKSSRRNLTVRTLRGGVANSWKLSDLAEEREGYGVCFLSVNIGRIES
jgi:hypothetical protein